MTVALDLNLGWVDLEGKGRHRNWFVEIVPVEKAVISEAEDEIDLSSFLKIKHMFCLIVVNKGNN